MNTYGRQPLVLVRGEDAGCGTTRAGNTWTLWRVWRCATWGTPTRPLPGPRREQLGRLVHVSNIYYTTPMVELAEELVCLSFADRVFFCNSGAEAMEGAIKLSRRYASQRFGPAP